ncbi:hypothetical protein CR513_54171, partial [Mucuna pruriens]
MPPDNETQFASRSITSFCAQLKIKQQFTSMEHPQLNRQVEAANKVILRGLWRRLEDAKRRWSEELPQFKHHDLVLRKITRTAESNKLTLAWKGPFRVIDEVGKGTYRLEQLDDRLQAIKGLRGPVIRSPPGNQRPKRTGHYIPSKREASNQRLKRTVTKDLRGSIIGSSPSKRRQTKDFRGPVIRSPTGEIIKYLSKTCWSRLSRAPKTYERPVIRSPPGLIIKDPTETSRLRPFGAPKTCERLVIRSPQGEIIKDLSDTSRSRLSGAAKTCEQSVHRPPGENIMNK